MDDLSRREELIDRNLKNGKIDEAAKLLFELIVRCADERAFEKAESLRERLFEFDPIALPYIIETAEIIDQKKRDAIDEDHLNRWSGLYAGLTVEEGNALYYAMKKKTCEAEKPLMKAGEGNSRLYFIDRGELKMIYHQGAKEILLKILSAGDTAGEDTFFEISDCTTTIVTLTPVELSFLDRSVLAKWKTEFPGIESKLVRFCSNSETTRVLLEKKNLDRRDQKRIILSKRIVLQPIDDSGNPEGSSFKGDLADISAGGASIFIYRSNKEMARMLLGRRLNLQFTLSSGASRIDINQNGLVIGVSDRLFNDYSIHARFDELLDNETVENIGSLLLKENGSRVDDLYTATDSDVGNGDIE